jgi:hypothetical protein
MSSKYLKTDSRIMNNIHANLNAHIQSIQPEYLKQIIHPRVIHDLSRYVPLSKHTKENSKSKSIKHSQSAPRVVDQRKKYIRSTRNIIRVSGHSPIKKNDRILLNDSIQQSGEPIKLFKAIHKNPKLFPDNLLKPSTLSPVHDFRYEKVSGIKKSMNIKPFMIIHNKSSKYLADFSIEASKTPTIKLQSATQYSSDENSSFLLRPDHKSKNSSLPSVNRSLSAPKFCLINESHKLKEPEQVRNLVYNNDYKITELWSDEEEVPLMKFTPRYSII